MSTKRVAVPAAVNEPDAAPQVNPAPEEHPIDLQALRDLKSDAHRECFVELHRLEGELRFIDQLIAHLNPQTPHQPATTAEGDK